MFSGVQSESVPNYFIDVDWNLEKVKSYFGDCPMILTRVLHSSSCPADVVRLLLKQGADINCQHGHSPLRIALQNTNDKEVIRVLLEGGAEVNEVDWKNKTPLLIYLEREYCSVDIVKMLLDFKADVNHKDKYGHSPLTTAIRRTKDDDVVIRALVEGGAEVNDIRDIHNSPLFVLLREVKNCSVNTVELLLANGADVNCVDNIGDSSLVCALRNKRGAEIIQVLLEKGANVNVVCRSGETPLFLLIRFCFYGICYNSSMVKLLLRYKADVNFINTLGESPLLVALRYIKDDEMVQLLLKEGAGVNTLDGSGRSPLCIAFGHSPSDIVKLLLDAGSSPNACTYHTNPLQCATDHSHSGLREDILDILLKTNVDVKRVDESGRSVLCFALQNGAKAKDIQLLLGAGAPINACTKHSSALVCVTNYHSLWIPPPLRKDLVQLLLDNGARVDDKGLEILQDALYVYEYDTGAIQLLLNLPGMDAYVVSKELLLHHAVMNRYCQIEAVKLLINRKVQVFSKNELGETPLHWAARNSRCDPRVIKLLLKHGCLVNAKTVNNKTPLMCALERHFEYNVLKELLLAGAHIGKDKFFILEFLEFLAGEWERCDNLKTLSSYEMLAKFYLLQNPKFDIKTFQHQTMFCVKKLSIFLNSCLNELRKMNLLQVGHGHTFRMFIRRDCSSHKKNYDVDKILTYLMKNTFPVYFDAISAGIGRSKMEAEVKKLQVYTNKTCSTERVNLNCDAVRKISEYLSDDEDLLKFILAFYKPVNQNDSGGTSKDDALLGKRSCKPSTKLAKCPKLYRC